jgi:hypothetical protein
MRQNQTSCIVVSCLRNICRQRPLCITQEHSTSQQKYTQLFVHDDDDDDDVPGARSRVGRIVSDGVRMWHRHLRAKPTNRQIKSHGAYKTPTREHAIALLLLYRLVDPLVDNLLSVVLLLARRLFDHFGLTNASRINERNAYSKINGVLCVVCARAYFWILDFGTTGQTHRIVDGNK